MTAVVTTVQTLEGHEDRVWNIAWSPSGNQLASCGGDKTVRIWERQNGNGPWICSAILEDTHTRTVRACAWDPTGKRLATASFDGTTAIWLLEGEMWECISSVEGHENEVKSVAWSPSGGLLATCGRDKTVWIWEALSGNEFECISVMQSHTQDVKCVCWHPSGEMLVSCSYDNTIRMWVEDADEDDWRCASTLTAEEHCGHASTVWGIAMHPSGRAMVSCSADHSLKLWTQGEGPAGEGAGAGWAHACTVTAGHDRPIFSVAYSPSGDHIAAGAGDDSIRIYGADPASGADALEGPARGSPREQAAVENAHQSDVNCVAWHPTVGGLLASAGDDGLVKLWQFSDSTAV